MKSQNLEFQISQLRQDKIIYAIESVAINLACVVFSLLTSMVANIVPLPGQLMFFLNIAIFTYGIGYTLYALFGNLSRLKQIKQLEAKL